MDSIVLFVFRRVSHRLYDVVNMFCLVCSLGLWYMVLWGFE